ncbi:hypothetical protein LOD99_2276 [Oopsacas minuta]|uniref:Uncharacterized protein n=1 Tax=Oopsacas minuta TaxID=111878 RepID=A0AAV7K3D4_9METZ|nr:hypothetical protein LOD99_2276 [Oopsacas minuta]
MWQGSFWLPNWREMMVWGRNPSGFSTPNALTTFKPIDIEMVKEVLNTYAAEEFWNHLTLGLTQNANKSLHNTIWSLSLPKERTYHLNLFRISTAIAVLTSSEGELTLFGILTDLGLHPSCRTYSAILKGEFCSDHSR